MPDDVEWIASTARQRDPSLEHAVALELAQRALPIARGLEELDAPEIARQLLAGSEQGASSVNAVAVATVDFLQR